MSTDRQRRLAPMWFEVDETARLNEVIAELRTRSSNLHEMSEEWEEHGEHAKSEDYWRRSEAFEIAANMLQGEINEPSKGPTDG